MTEQRPTNLGNSQAQAEADTSSTLPKDRDENLSPTQQRAERAEEIAEQRSHHAPVPDNEDAR